MEQSEGVQSAQQAATAALRDMHREAEHERQRQRAAQTNEHGLISQIKQRESRMREARNEKLEERKQLKMLRRAEANAVQDYQAQAIRRLERLGGDTSIIADIKKLKLEV